MINKKATSILCYCSLIGWLVAYLAGDKDNAKLDINQGLVLSLAEVGIGIIGCYFWPYTSIHYEDYFWPCSMAG